MRVLRDLHLAMNKADNTVGKLYISQVTKMNILKQTSKICSTSLGVELYQDKHCDAYGNLTDIRHQPPNNCLLNRKIKCSPMLRFKLMCLDERNSRIHPREWSRKLKYHEMKKFTKLTSLEIKKFIRG